MHQGMSAGHPALPIAEPYLGPYFDDGDVGIFAAERGRAGVAATAVQDTGAAAGRPAAAEHVEMRRSIPRSRWA